MRGDDWTPMLTVRKRTYKYQELLIAYTDRWTRERDAIFY